jgi:hypothetical protein
MQGGHDGRVCSAASGTTQTGLCYWVAVPKELRARRINSIARWFPRIGYGTWRATSSRSSGCVVRRSECGVHVCGGGQRRWPDAAAGQLKCINAFYRREAEHWRQDRERTEAEFQAVQAQVKRREVC